MSHALIAGAAGFLGSHLTDRLLADGFDVIGVDNFVTGSRENLAHLEGSARFSFVHADVSHPLAVEGKLSWVFHLASPASPPKYLQLPIETMRANAEGTRHLLELARRKDAKFFLASTSEVYGDPAVHPQVETYWGNVNPVGPRAVYDEAKRYAEAMTVAYQRTYGLDVRIVRIFNTYGPRMDPHDGRVVTNFVNQALRGDPLTVYGDGLQTRSFCYVDDLIAGFALLMQRGDERPVNLGNPTEFTMLDLAHLVRTLTRRNIPVVHRPLPVDDPKQRKPDITRARTLLRWEPKVDLESGLRETIRYFERKGG